MTGSSGLIVFLHDLNWVESGPIFQTVLIRSPFRHLDHYLAHMRSAFEVRVGGLCVVEEEGLINQRLDAVLRHHLEAFLEHAAMAAGDAFDGDVFAKDRPLPEIAGVSRAA